MDLSFETISATGANAALPHYKPSSTVETVVTKDKMYLIDSGAQYM